MIQILITGGTFDKSYDHIHGKLYFEKTHLPQMLKRSRCQLEVQVETLMMVDSLELTDRDLDRITQACISSPATQMVITHGTDRMVTTATRLAQEKELKHKTIVLTGAMIPYAFGSSSDGFFNLGSALAWVQSLAPEVYVAMQGEYFRWDQVYKDQSQGVFRRKKT